MKELLGYIENIPSAARHRALRWQLESVARLVAWHLCQIAWAAGYAIGEAISGIARLVAWHLYNAAGFVVYQVREALRWRR